MVNGDLFDGETKGRNTAKDETGDKDGNQAGKKGGNKGVDKGVDKAGKKARVDMDVSGLVSSPSPPTTSSLSSSVSSTFSSSAPITLRHLIQKTTAERVKVFNHPVTSTTPKNPRKDLVEAILTYQPICSFSPPGPTTIATKSAAATTAATTATTATTSTTTTAALATVNSSNTPRQTLLKIALETGRKHQIRAQMSHIGHPIVGDVKYGASQGMLMP